MQALLDRYREEEDVVRHRLLTSYGGVVDSALPPVLPPALFEVAKTSPRSMLPAPRSPVAPVAPVVIEKEGVAQGLALTVSQADAILARRDVRNRG